MSARRTILILVGLTLALALTACGRKSNPKPPELSAPMPVRNFAAAGDVDAVVLSWDAPDATVEEDELRDLAGFYVERSDYVRGEQPAYEQIAEIKAAADPAVRSYQFRDTSVEPGKVYEYSVLAYTSEGDESTPGQTLRVTFLGQSSKIEGFDVSKPKQR